MSNRQNQAGRPPARQIRGPHSALTDFLASQNISASRIRSDNEARRNAAAAAGAAEGPDGTPDDPAAAAAAAVAEAGDDSNEGEAGPATSAARTAAAAKKKNQAAAIEKIKKSKAYKKRKRAAEDSDSEDLARAMFNEKTVPLPGQMENCAICDKRFTVTPYSPAGPQGGLLCSKCSKDLANDDDGAKKKKKKSAGKAGGAGRRSVQSRILDGTYTTGAKSLMTLCIELLAKNIDLADDLGDVPPVVIDRIARMLSKRRLLNSHNLTLFLQPNAEEVKVYDAAKLSSDDFIRIFQTVSKLQKLKVRNAIQFKDEVMDYLVSRHITLRSIYIHGANLLSEEKWRDYLAAKGKHLEGLQVYYTDKHFGDDLVADLNTLCPSLKRLKIAHNQKMTDRGIENLAKLEGLEHLGLQLLQPTSTEPYVAMINGIGSSLRTLSLRGVMDVDDRLLDALHLKCRSLTKLRITDSEVFTDAGFARLFTNWANKPLQFLDLQKCRHVDAAKPRENAHKLGLCSEGFRALMRHSGKSLQYLNVHSCRHITREAFEDVFSADKEYPELRKVQISFCEEVTDFIVGSIFRSCPNLRELNVFGCMKFREVRVPKGVLLVGVPNAIGMVVEGTD